MASHLKKPLTQEDYFSVTWNNFSVGVISYLNSSSLEAISNLKSPYLTYSHLSTLNSAVSHEIIFHLMVMQVSAHHIWVELNANNFNFNDKRSV